MKKFVLAASVTLFLAVVAIAPAAHAYTYGEHLASAYDIYCDKKCGGGSEAKDVCVKKMEAEVAKDANKAVAVQAGKSGACVFELMGANCTNWAEKMKGPKCSFEALK